MENNFLEQKRKGEKILFSELLAAPPSDDVLIELFPNTLTPNRPLVTQRGLEVLKLRLEGLRQSEIAERLGLKRGQVTYASTTTKNCLHGNIPPYIDVDIPSLRRILGMQQKERTGYILLSELLRDMPSDEELLNLFVERGNIIRAGGKTPPTNQDLRLLQMRSENQSYESIGEKAGMDAGDVRHQISLTIMRIRRDLKIEADVPELYRPRKPLSQADQAQPPEPRPDISKKRLDVLSERQRGGGAPHEQGMSSAKIARELGISYMAKEGSVVKYSQEEIKTIIDLAFKGARSDPALLDELQLSHTELTQMEQLFRREDVLLGLEVVFNGIHPQKPSETNPLFEAADRYPIEYLDLSARAYTFLIRSDRYGRIRTVADLLRLSDADLSKIRGLTPYSKSFQEVKCKREKFVEDFNAGKIK